MFQLLKRRVLSKFTPLLSWLPSRSNLSSLQINANRLAFWIPGFALASWSPLIPFIKNNFNLDAQDLGFLLLCPATGAGSTVILGPFVIAALGCKNTVRLMGLLIILGLLSITLVTNVYLLGAILFVYGLTVECVSLAANLNAVTLERALNRPLLSGMHGMISLGNVAGVILVATMLQLEVNWPVPMLCGAVGLSVLVLTVCSQITSSYLLSKEQIRLLTTHKALTTNHLTLNAQGLTPNAKRSISHNAQGQASSGQTQGCTSGARASINARALWFKTLSQPLIWCLGIMCLVVYVTEDSMNDWSGIYLTQVFALPLQQAGWGFLAFASMMALSRFLGDSLVMRFGRKNVIFGGASLTALGLVIATSDITPGLSILGFGLIGLGTANITPQCISFAASLRTVPQSQSLFAVNGIGAVGSLFGPVLIGQISAHWSLHITFLLLALCLGGVAGLSLLLRSTSILAAPVDTQAASAQATWDSTNRRSELTPSQTFPGYGLRLAHSAYWWQLRLMFPEMVVNSSLEKSDDFSVLENPFISCQSFSLQHWVMSIEEPPGRH